MKTFSTGARIAVKNILFLTDFSEPSEAALPYAVSIAREFGATVHAFHVLLPEPLAYTAPETVNVALEVQEERAQAEMQRVEGQLEGLPHELAVARGAGVWPALEQAITSCKADLIVLGTHGRTGAQKLLLGSVAEEIFRRSQIPVLTIGPWARKGLHNAAHFHRVLYATDFTPDSLAAVPYAISLAQEHEARLILLHVTRPRDPDAAYRPDEPSVANALYELHELVPKDAELWCRPEAVLEFGEPSARILEAARSRNADLIVLGVRNAKKHMGAATHLEGSIAHKIVAHAHCPVLTVRV